MSFAKKNNSSYYQSDTHTHIDNKKLIRSTTDQDHIRYAISRQQQYSIHSLPMRSYILYMQQVRRIHFGRQTRRWDYLRMRRRRNRNCSTLSIHNFNDLRWTEIGTESSPFASELIEFTLGGVNRVPKSCDCHLSAQLFRCLFNLVLIIAVGSSFLCFPFYQSFLLSNAGLLHQLLGDCEIRTFVRVRTHDSELCSASNVPEYIYLDLEDIS